MKSLKEKLIVVILTMVIVSSLTTVTIGLIQGFNLTETVIHTQFKSKLTGASNMLKLYLKEQFGSLSIAGDGKIVDKDAKPIDGRNDYIDKLSQSMDVVATVFAKTGNDYTRLLTTINDDKGERLIGTKLDAKGKAYKEVVKGNVYFGEADIVGKQYLTSYTPIFDNNQIIGIYFVGVPVESVNNIVNDGRTSTIKFVALLSIAVILIASVISYLVANSIAKPIKKITGAAQEIADGNFDIHLSVKSRDEVGKLAESFNLTVKRLLNYQGYIDEVSDVLMQISKGNLTVQLQRDYVGQFKKLKDNMEALIGSLNFTLLQINESAEQVSSGSDQVSSGAQALAQGTTEQASSIEELSASIAEISEQIKQNASNANNSNEKIGVVGSEINLSNENMKSMILAMKDINTKSSEIGTIIKAIDDIAFQTNILALNAAVEAARAGSAGKGFAVVAGEVKNLANKSAAAAKDIAKLIEGSIKSIGNGTSIADETAKSLHLVVTSTMETVELIKNISKASNEQANSISQINQGVEQISEIIQTNSATAEESSAASEELSAQAESLKQLVAKFTLKD